MAPSATSLNSPQEGRVHAMEVNTKQQEGDSSIPDDVPVPNSPRTKLYTDAYTHGYTEGYIAGNEVPRRMPIAIVGMACRLPGNVSTPDEFWGLCSRARSGWSEIPKERFEPASFRHPNPGKGGCFNPNGGHFLKEDIALFDAPFFSLTAQEATSMDVQQRILLECTFEALENAGIPKHEVVGKDMGVFIGGSFSEYEAQAFADPDTIPMYQATGCAFAMQSNRISHFFDLRGPSFTVDTACSSSLVALHQACQSIRNGESKSAIVGSCHLNMLPESWISFSKSRLFSDEGRSFSFDNRGTGYGRGEGCGILVLKPLDQALKDGDSIRSVILNSGINQDGKTPGITMPNGAAQESLMKSVYKDAGIDPKDTGYVEAHGTGTKVGDPIEAAALYNVFGEGRSARNPLFIGSVKSNIGHLEAASGIVAVIKTALMLERGFILPNFDFKKPNEKIPFSKWNLKVPVSQRPWPRSKRFASVNNFGFGGTNAHIVMERAPFFERSEAQMDSVVQPPRIFALSANDKNSLEALMKNTGIYLEQRPEIFQSDLMSNLAHTLSRRSLLQWRVAISTTSSFDLIQALNSGKVLPVRADIPRIGFVFTGQGAQYYNMGRELKQYPVYASTIETCDKYLASLGAPFSLLDELDKDATESRINEAHISQPACTAVQLALTDLLKSWGVSPTAVAGHSSGEIGAAYAAGILTLTSCMAISYYRGMATKGLKKKSPLLRGSMLAVGGTKEDIEPLLAQLKAKEARIACFNSPSSLTISGDEAAIDELQGILEQSQVFNRKLQVDMAYHSHHMNLVAEEYRQSLQFLQLLDPPKSTPVTFHSSLFGTLVNPTVLEPSYWVDNLTQPVRFSEAIVSMCKPVVESHKTGISMIVEIGPSGALSGPIKQILKANGKETIAIPYFSALARNKDAVETALELASALFVKGAPVDLTAINPTARPGNPPELLIDMPRYSWNHSTRYWHEGRIMKIHKGRKTPRHDLLGTLATYSNDLEPTWRNVLRLDDLPWLRHHQIQSLNLFPMAGFISMVVEAVSQTSTVRNIPYDSFLLREITVHTPLIIMDEDIEITMQLRPYREEGIAASPDVWDEFRIHSWTASKGWTEHCKGFVTVKCGLQNSAESILAEASGAETIDVEKSNLYDSLHRIGVSYGSSFQGMNNCRSSDTCSTATLTTVDTSQEMPQAFQTESVIHPAILEQLIEMYWPILGAGRTAVKSIYLPSSIGSMTISRTVTDFTRKAGDSMKAFCKGSLPHSNVIPATLSMCATSLDDPKHVLIEVNDLVVSPIVERDVVLETETPRELCYKLDWEPFTPSSNSSAEIEITNGVVNGESKHSTEVSNVVSNGTSNCISSVSNASSEFPSGHLVIVHGDSTAQKVFASELADSIELLCGNRPMFGTLPSIDTAGKLCLFVSELDESLLSSESALDSVEFSALKDMLTGVDGILWVVRGAYIASQNPNANMITGFSRTIRSETLLKFATLDLDAEGTISNSIETILTVIKATFGPKAGSDCELEFVERDGVLLTPRVVNDLEMNEYVHKEIKGSIFEPTLFGKQGRPLQMTIGQHGDLGTLYFTDQTILDPVLDDEIELEVKAIGMNRSDMLVAMGLLPTGLGVECSGTVTKIGSDVTNLALGDNVACLSVSPEGVYSTYTRTKAAFTIPVKTSFPFLEAASIPVAYCTAYYALFDLGRLLKGDRVLIHGAESAAGQAALCLANTFGAESFAVVRSEEGKEVLKKSFGMHDHQISLGDTSSFGNFDEGNFDIVLNCVSANSDTMRALWRSSNSFGRFIEVKETDSHANVSLGTSGLKANRSLMSVDLMSIAPERPKLIERLLFDISGLMQQGKLIAPSLTEFSISEVEKALGMLQDGKSDGKLIISPKPDAQVKATPWNQGEKLLRSDVSYILIGGTGGLGRSIARWMVSQGARSIVLVSRTGNMAGKVKTLIDELPEANIVVKSCDVANSSSVEKFITEGMVGMPTVGGVIHGAMVLNDVLFEKMTFEQYTTVIEAKVRGAWNFHNALKSTRLDFFVAISSAAGVVGNRGQAAYSAANTFLNAFVQYRLRLGLPASSLDLTAVSDAGYLAENAEAAAEVSKNLGSDTICEAEVLALLGAAINGRLASTCNNHTITGMRITPSHPFWTNDAKFKHLRLAAEAAETSEVDSVAISYKASLKAATCLVDAEKVVQNGLLSKLPSVLMLEAEDMDVTRSLSSYALDSLVAIEVRNYITREFEANLQVLELLSSGSIETLSKAICGKSKLVTFGA